MIENIKTKIILSTYYDAGYPFNGTNPFSRYPALLLIPQFILGSLLYFVAAISRYF